MHSSAFINTRCYLDNAKGVKILLLELFLLVKICVFRQIIEAIGVYGLIHVPFTDEYKRSQNTHTSTVL